MGLDSYRTPGDSHLEPETRRTSSKAIPPKEEVRLAQAYGPARRPEFRWFVLRLHAATQFYPPAQGVGRRGHPRALPHALEDPCAPAFQQS